MRNVIERMSIFSHTMMLFLLAILATSAHSEIFASVIENQRFTLTCDGLQVIDTPCRIAVNSSEEMQVRFSTERTHYAHLLRQGIEKVLEEKKPGLQTSASDVSLLRELSLEQCHPVEKSRDISGDLLQLCVASKSSSVVLFMRGLCDHCEFRPLVLKKQAR
jgi:hypothetical protein